LLVLDPSLKLTLIDQDDAFPLQKVQLFLLFCRKIGLKDRDIFSITDLEEKNVAQIVRTFCVLSSKVSSFLQKKKTD